MVGATSQMAMQHKIKSRRLLSAWILALLVSPLLARPSLAQLSQANAAQKKTPADNPPSRVARVSYLKGSVSFLRAGLDQWSQAALNFPATTGDRIYSDHGAMAELEVGPYAVRLSDATDLTITNLNDQIMQLALEQGTLRISVYQLPSDNTVEVDTPNGAIMLRGAGKYRVDADPSVNRTLVSVHSGRLEVTGGGVSQTIEDRPIWMLTGIGWRSVNMVPFGIQLFPRAGYRIALVIGRGSIHGAGLG